MPSEIKLDATRGFGSYHRASDSPKYQAAIQVAKVSLGILGFAAIGAGLSAISLCYPLIPIGMSVGMLTASSTAFSTAAVTSIISEAYLNRRKKAFYDTINALNSSIALPPVKLGEESDCSSLACANTVESFEWKKKLIEAANSNIVLSGNYCGGESFGEILRLIEKQMHCKPGLKVVLISSDRFITSDNKSLITHLKEIFGDRFQLVESPDIWHVNPGIKRTTNHSKILAVDYGRYFLLGGSGIEDKYAYSNGLEEAKAPCPTDQRGGILYGMLPQNFRDQDFVFSSPTRQGTGRRVYIEALNLAMEWEGLNSLKTSHEENTHSVAKNLLQDETNINHVNGRTHTADSLLEEKASFIPQTKTKILCMGPEHTENPFEKEILHQLKNAKERIVIDHMYFHPTAAILIELANAAKRGVKVTIVTNGLQADSPLTHNGFAPRNRYNYQ